jgi:hypothetical protein
VLPPCLAAYPTTQALLSAASAVQAAIPAGPGVPWGPQATLRGHPRVRAATLWPPLLLLLLLLLLLHPPGPHNESQVQG